MSSTLRSSARRSLRSSLTISLPSSLTSTAHSTRQTRQYIQRLATLYDDQQCDIDQKRLRNALQETGEHAQGIGAVEVYRYRERLGDLEWLDLWRQDGVYDEAKPDPVVPGTGLVGTIWSSQWNKPKPPSRSSSGAALDATVESSESSDMPAGGQQVLVWRDLKSIDMDPDTWHARRDKEHLELGWTRAAGVEFESDGIKGVVIYYAQQGVDKDVLNALTHTVYLKRCAVYIGSIVAMSEARRAHCLSDRGSQNSEKKSNDEETPPPETVKLESFPSADDAAASNCMDHLKTKATAWYYKCWGGGLQIPPPMELQQVAWTWLGAFCGLLVLSLINELFLHFTDQEYSVVLGPFGAMMTLLYALPSAPASQPRNVILGEAIAGAVSMALSYLPIPKWARRAITPSFGIAAMTACGVVHPPAGAHATIWADQDHNWGFYAIVVLCSAVSVIPATIINNMSMKRQYPTYWGYLPKWLYEKVFGTKED